MNSADADADGLPNILEFAFGTDPDVPGRGRLSGLQDGLPISGEPAVVRKTGTQGMVARYSRYADRANSGIEYFPQFSADLQVWETRVLGQESLGISGNYELMEVPFPATLTTGEPPRFFRVKVEVKP
jgi:hypothetical protein